MRKLFFLASFFVTYTAHTQDTLRIMSYNVLNYSSSHYPTRYNDMKEILMHVKPDIVVCSEMVDASGAELLLDNAFNMAGLGTFSRSTFIDGPDTDNMIYYNTGKVKFKAQYQITTALRNITRYRMYFLISPTDTAWMDIFSCHLKASSGFEAERLAECQDLCTYMAGMDNNQNIIVGGDFNFYGSSTETGFNWLTSTNCSHQLYDPINRIGNWNNNSSFKDVHTQSTRVNNEPDGGSTGGMDDRFDFLFTNANVMDGTDKVRYVYDSYTTVGQDANHFNLAVTDSPTNSAVPASVANALYDMSDHLPIYFDVAIAVDINVSEYAHNLTAANVVWINDGNAMSESRFIVNSTKFMQTTLEVTDMSGKKVVSQQLNLNSGDNYVTLTNADLQKGQYLLTIKNNEGWIGCKFLRF
ncbi:MAG TPA: T9SS type A sorting domain-containing protein [Flavobacteriales bacterium]|nr:T9SS type A sorting domain-containing protein [Flavobacteriales bacterium]